MPINASCSKSSCNGLAIARRRSIAVTTPLLPEALQRCQRLGYARILVFPFFLFTGVLEKRIRTTTAEFAGRHPDTEFLCAGYLNAHPLLYEVFLERAEEALHGSPERPMGLLQQHDV